MTRGTAAAPDAELVFLPLGGAGEIGMNLNLYGYGPPDARAWIMCDLGITFADDAMPGVEIVLPDPTFIAERREDLLGIVLTHGHEDHIGAVPHLWPSLRCPIYATPFTAGLVRDKLREAGLEAEAPVTEVPLSGHLKLGPFDLRFVTLTHSILEPNALAIRTPLGTVVHTGDWKLDPEPQVGGRTDEVALRTLGDEGVLALVCDSTNVFQPGRSGSEEAVHDSLADLIRGLTGRIAVTTFASNAARLQTLARVAASLGRRPVLVGRSMKRIVGVAREAGYLRDLPPFVAEEDAGDLPRDVALYLCTGSQGEPRAALMRIAQGDHPTVTLDDGDTVVFSSRIIPGNETRIFRLQNLLAERGVRVITEHDHFVHVSGHPCRDELGDMYQWARPHIAVPVHGELRHLVEHVAFARELQVPETVLARNGDLVRLAPGAPGIVDAVHAGRLHIDGTMLVAAEDTSVRDRRRIAQAGLIGVTLVVGGDGRLAVAPQVTVNGTPRLAYGAPDDTGDTLVDMVGKAAEIAYGALGPRERGDSAAAAEAVRRAARRAAAVMLGKKPITQVQVIRLA